MITTRAVCSASQARALDEQMRRHHGIGADRLMDAAATAAALRIRDVHPDPLPIHILAGPGNNGGDGWAIARILSQCGYPTTVHCRTAVHPSQREAVETLRGSVRIESDFTGAPPDSVLVDALYGIGLNRPIEAIHAEWIRVLNGSDRPVWSVDMPSGLDATDGITAGACVNATHTLALGVFKSGYWAGVGPERCGRIHLIPLGFPARELSEVGASVFFAHDLPATRIRSGSHKYQRGTVHVVGGSAGMTGAVVMAAAGAWDGGAGAVMAHVPAGCLPAVEAQLVEPVKVGYGSAGSTAFTKQDVDAVLSMIRSKPGILVLGPGLGRHPETMAFVRALIADIETPTVVDADALAALPDRLPPVSVLTPHPGELSAMTGSPAGAWSDRQTLARELSARTGATVVSKGQPTAVFTPDGRIRIAGYDTRPFSRMGAGDVLAGRIGTYLTADRTHEAIVSALLAGVQSHADPHPTAL
jgi:NAD(P)H-hydrate epimerase